jgi:hypothetical protein
MNKWNIFSLLYVIVWGILLTIELIGVFTHYRPIDTMSQWVWFWRDLMPVTSRIVITLFLLWLWYHFCIYQGRVMD